MSAKWENCYDSSWKGLITDASFAHPAKFARGLIERIYDRCLAKGYLKKGDVVGDCFGGIGTGGITAAYRGLNWVGCELEPKFVAFANENFEMHRRFFDVMGLPMPRIIQGDSRKFDEHVAGIVSSPPYADSINTPPNDEARAKRCDAIGRSDIAKRLRKPEAWGHQAHTKYGEHDGQIGSLKSGAVEAVISSPPFTQGYQSGGGINKNGYTKGGKHWREDKSIPDYVGSRTYQGQGGDRTAGNIETLKEGTVQGVISSPPYSDIAAGAGGLNTKPAKKPGQQSGRNPGAASQSGNWSKEIQRYGTSTGQISQLEGGSVDGVVSSPPYEGTCLSGGGGIVTRDEEMRKTHGYNVEAENCGATEGQIGKEAGETYWQAVDAVYRACFRAIRPGGVIVLVVKDYCSKGKRVRLCDDTMRLLEHIGFVPLERIYAMLVTETVENGLFGEEKTKKQRKSFFRRLYEAKLPEQDERRIDHEEILICRKQ